MSPSAPNSNTKFSSSDRDRVVHATDLVALVGEHVQLKPKGREHIGLCPFHDDSRASMNVVTHKGTPFYHCFSCGATGTAIDFMMQFHKLSFPEALRALAERASIELTGTMVESDRASHRRLLKRATDAAARWFRRRLLDETVGAEARAFLTTRAINETMSEAFQLGVAPEGWDGLVNRVSELERHARSGDRGESIDLQSFVTTGLIGNRKSGNGHFDVFRNRIIFPICDDMGAPIAFGGRVLPETKTKASANDRTDREPPKYLNSPETPLFDKSKTLYALHLARKPIIDSGHAIVVEGYTDAIACHQAGICNVVATLGTALTAAHAAKLGRLCRRVVLVFDGDAAGQRAADRAVEVFFASEIDLGICTLPDNHDPDSIIKLPDGNTLFRNAIDTAPELLDYLGASFKADFDAAHGVSERQHVIKRFLERLSGLGLNDAGDVRRHLILDYLSALTGLSEPDLQRELSNLTPRRMPVVANERAEVEVEQTPVEEVPSSTSSRRREGERRLLAMVVHDAALYRTSVDAGDGTWLPASELFDAMAFDHPPHRALAKQLVDQIESGETPLVGDLLLASTTDAERTLLTDLLCLGRDQISNTRDAPEVLFATFCNDLRQVQVLESHRIKSLDPKNPNTAEAFSQQLALLKERGLDRAAVARIDRPQRPRTSVRKSATGATNRRGRGF